MVVREHSLPQRRDFIVSQTNVAGANRSARKSANKNTVWIASEVSADSRQIGFAVIDGRLSVAPPGDGIFFTTFFDVGHRNPDEFSAAADAVAQVRVFDFP